MKRICTICARGGSKGVKNKNIRPLLGVPLIAHSIRHAQECGLFDAISVSSDSEDILRTAEDHGIEYCIRRPDELASDTAAKIPAIRHAVQETEKLTGMHYDVCVDLDVTAPLRLPADIAEAIQQFEKHQCDNLFSVCPAHRSPYFNMVERGQDGKVRLSKDCHGIVRRQDAPECFDMNASIYIWKRDVLEKEDKLFMDNTDIYIMPPERSVDIDSEIDFKIVEYIMKEIKN